MKHVLAIDPSIRKTGYAVLTYEKKPKIVTLGTLRVKKGADYRDSFTLFAKKLYEIETNTGQTIGLDYQFICFERFEAFTRNVNIKSLNKLWRSLFISIEVLTEMFDCPLLFATPKQWKQNRSKKQTDTEFRLLYPGIKSSSDSRDAVGVGRHLIAKTLYESKIN